MSKSIVTKESLEHALELYDDASFSDDERQSITVGNIRDIVEINKRDNERIARLEAIIRAARHGEYNNAREIHAIEKFLSESMQEYYTWLEKSK